MKKLTLVSISLRGKFYSGFFYLDSVSPKINESEMFARFGVNPPRGTTYTKG